MLLWLRWFSWILWRTLLCIDISFPPSGRWQNLYPSQESGRWSTCQNIRQVRICILSEACWISVRIFPKSNSASVWLMLSIQDYSLCCCSPGVFPPFRGSLWRTSIYRFCSHTTLANRWLPASFWGRYSRNRQSVLQFSFSDRTVPFHRNATLRRCAELHILSPMLSSIRPWPMFPSMIFLRRYVDTVSVDGFHYMFYTTICC